MGLNISPSIWQSYINAILNCLQSKKYCEATMDDLLLFTLLKSSHIAKLGRFIESIVEEWFENIPKDEIFIRDKRVCVKPPRSRLEVIQKLQPPLQ